MSITDFTHGSSLRQTLTWIKTRAFRADRPHAMTTRKLRAILLYISGTLFTAHLVGEISNY